MNVKTILTVVLVCGGLAALGGCASMGKGKDSSALTSAINDNVDLAYIAQVNQQASQRFAKVIWVNPPQKLPAGQHN